MKQYEQLILLFKQSLQATIDKYVKSISDSNDKIDASKTYRIEDISALKKVLMTQDIMHDVIKGKFARILNKMKTGLFCENSFFVSSLSCFGYKGVQTGNSTLKDMLYDVLYLPKFSDNRFLRKRIIDLEDTVARFALSAAQPMMNSNNYPSDRGAFTSATELDELSLDESESLGTSFFNAVNKVR